MKTEDIQAIRNKIEKSKVKIGLERDKLRKLHDELTTLVECLDGAKEDFEIADDYFQSAIDKLSEQV